MNGLAYSIVREGKLWGVFTPAARGQTLRLAQHGTRRAALTVAGLLAGPTGKLETYASRADYDDALTRYREAEDLLATDPESAEAALDFYDRLVANGGTNEGMGGPINTIKKVL